MEELINILPIVVALVTVIGSYFLLKAKTESNSNAIIALEMDYNSIIKDLRDKIEETRVELNTAIICMRTDMNDKASKDSMREIKRELREEILGLKNDINDIRNLILTLIKQK